jgi:hypothetical protein
MERSVEILAVVLFGVIGLSHVVQPRAWVDYFIFIRGKRETGAFIDGLVHLPLSALIIGFHNVWSGIPAVLTVLGWLFLIKSILRFCLPTLALRMMARVSVERAWEFQAAGVVLLLIAGLLGFGLSVG